MSAAGMVSVYEVFKNPDFNRFRLIKKNTNSTKLSEPQLAKPEIKKLYEVEKAAENIQVNDAIYIFEAYPDNEKVKEWRQRNFTQYEKEVKKNKQLQKDLEKICMEHPEERISSFSEALKRLSKIADIAAQRVEKYPPKNDKDDQYFTQGVLLYTKWIQSIADLKHSRSNYSWMDIGIEQDSQSTHSAMSKSKIEAMFASPEFKHLEGLLRKVTREQIDAKKPIIIEIAKQVTICAAMLLGEIGAVIRDVFQTLIDEEHPQLLVIASKINENTVPLITIDIYKDMCQAPWNGGFHIRRHDKLSESAFGNSTLA
jgi:hypothetical protein